MNETAFWKLVDASRRGNAEDLDAQGEALVERLSKLPLEELVSFEDHFERRAAEAYRADLWGAAFLINGGCSDDGFADFVGWLISRGEKVFRAALDNPDSLARVAGEGDAESFEEILYAASRAYEQTTGKDDFYDHLPKRPAKKLKGNLRSWSGSDGDMDEAKCRKLYPRLWKKFCAG
ncbi:MAG: DUF4240 domain-containing protein [Myxococcales bacterium]